MRNVSVFGLGYVGAVTAACLTRCGYRVVGVDVSPQKVEMLGSGRAPVLEPGLQELVAEGTKEGRLRATTDTVTAIEQTDLSFICVGTPSMHNGKLDLRSVESSCREIGKALRRKNTFHWIVTRSTVLPGTGRSLVIPTVEAASGKREGVDFAVCSHPEFTREGCAVADFLNPSITILGSDDPSQLVPLREIYDGFPGRIIETSLSVAEMVKYTCNAFHALKVVFANEVGTICEHLDVDGKAVMDIVTADTKLNISPAYLKPGGPFGGSCLPKDLRAIVYRAKQLDLDLPLLNSIVPSNDAHLEREVETILATRAKNIGVLGLSFKAGTDDLRESPYVRLIKRLLGEGCNVQIWDPNVALGRLSGSNRQFIEEEIPHIGACLSDDLEKTIQNADVVAIGTDIVDPAVLAALIRSNQTVINLHSPVSRNKTEFALSHWQQTSQGPTASLSI